MAGVDAVGEKTDAGQQPKPIAKPSVTESAEHGSRTGSLTGEEGPLGEELIGRTPSKLKDKEKKLGHRRVDHQGQVTYKRKPTSELMAAIQLGIGQSIGSLSSRPERDLLMHDFTVVQSVFFPSEGSNLTPAHHCSDFRFKTYAPIAFRYFRELFGIAPDDFLVSLCDEPLEELSNPGASGSIFYRTYDDEFIIKTVQHKEAEFLQKLLPGYYMNLNQNPRTLLPKFYGLFCYQHGGKNIRFIIMNNLLPSSIKMHEKYDLKGSSYKRRASKQEIKKKSPTLKDLDFPEQHSEGLYLEQETYKALMQTIHRDCMVLESFKIMDYSLLLGVYNLDQAQRDKQTQGRSPRQDREHPDHGVAAAAAASSSFIASAASAPAGGALHRARSVKQRLAQYSTAIESIQAHNTEPVDIDEDEHIPPGGIPARSSKDERLLLFIGIIDILQSFRLKKKMEHAFKSMITDGDTVSVHRPSFYSRRFQDFFAQTVFRKVPTSMKSSPSKKKSSRRIGSDSQAPEERGAVGGQPDLLQSTTTKQVFSQSAKTNQIPLQSVVPNQVSPQFGKNNQALLRSTTAKNAISQSTLDNETQQISNFANEEPQHSAATAEEFSNSTAANERLSLPSVDEVLPQAASSLQHRDVQHTTEACEDTQMSELKFQQPAEESLQVTEERTTAQHSDTESETKETKESDSRGFRRDLLPPI